MWLHSVAWRTQWWEEQGHSLILALTQQIDFVGTLDYLSVALGYSLPSSFPPRNLARAACSHRPACEKLPKETQVAEGTEQPVRLGGGEGGGRGAGRVGGLGAGRQQQDLGAGPRAGGKGSCGHLCPWGRQGCSLSALQSHINPACLAGPKSPLEISLNCHSPVNPARLLNAKQVMQPSPSLSGLGQAWSSGFLKLSLQSHVSQRGVDWVLLLLFLSKHLQDPIRYTSANTITHPSPAT